MPDGKSLVSVSADASARLWEISTHRELAEFDRSVNGFWSVTVSPDGSRIAAGTYEGSIKIWNPGPAQELLTLKIGFTQRHAYARTVWGLTFLPDGNTLVSSTESEIRAWRAPSWKEIAEAEEEQRQEMQRLDGSTNREARAKP